MLSKLTLFFLMFFTFSTIGFAAGYDGLTDRSKKWVDDINLRMDLPTSSPEHCVRPEIAAEGSGFPDAPIKMDGDSDSGTKKTTD